MTSTIKSLYGKLCVLLATIVWVVYFGQHVLSNFLAFVPGRAVRPVFMVFLVVLTIGVAWYVWPKVAHLAIKEVVDSRKATIGIFLLTLALAAFPGTVILPFAYAAWSGRSEASLYAWYAVLGVPVFIVLSIIGLILTFGSRPKDAA